MRLETSKSSTGHRSQSMRAHAEAVGPFCGGVPVALCARYLCLPDSPLPPTWTPGAFCRSRTRRCCCSLARRRLHATASSDASQRASGTGAGTRRAMAGRPGAGVEVIVCVWCSAGDAVGHKAHKIPSFQGLVASCPCPAALGAHLAPALSPISLGDAVFYPAHSWPPSSSLPCAA